MALHPTLGTPYVVNQGTGLTFNGTSNTWVALGSGTYGTGTELSLAVHPTTSTPYLAFTQSFVLHVDQFS